MKTETKEVKDILQEVEKHRKVALVKIDQQIKNATELYDSLMTKLNKYSEEDRERCKAVYDKMFTLVNNAEKLSAGMLDALNSSMGNLLSSTQRQRELLQEIGKTKSKLEEVQTMMSDDKSDEEDLEFNLADHIN